MFPTKARLSAFYLSILISDNNFVSSWDSEASIGRDDFLKMPDSPSANIPKEFEVTIHLSNKTACSVGKKVGKRKKRLFLNYPFGKFWWLFSLNTITGFFKLISNTILTARIQIDFLSTEPGSDSLSLKIIMTIIIIVEIPTPAMIDKLSCGENNDLIDCSH